MNKNTTTDCGLGRGCCWRAGRPCCHARRGGSSSSSSSSSSLLLRRLLCVCAAFAVWAVCATEVLASPFLSLSFVVVFLSFSVPLVFADLKQVGGPVLSLVFVGDAEVVTKQAYERHLSARCVLSQPSASLAASL